MPVIYILPNLRRSYMSLRFMAVLAACLVAAVPPLHGSPHFLDTLRLHWRQGRKKAETELGPSPWWSDTAVCCTGLRELGACRCGIRNTNRKRRKISKDSDPPLRLFPRVLQFAACRCRFPARRNQWVYTCPKGSNGVAEADGTASPNALSQP